MVSKRWGICGTEGCISLAALYFACCIGREGVVTGAMCTFVNPEGEHHYIIEVYGSAVFVAP